MRTIQLSDNADTINRALTMLPELVDKVAALIKKDEKRRKSLLLLLVSKWRAWHRTLRPACARQTTSVV